MLRKNHYVVFVSVVSALFCLAFLFVSCTQDNAAVIEQKQYGTIQGKVLFSNGIDHSGITLTLDMTDGKRDLTKDDASRAIVSMATTKEDGSFEFTGILPGSYTIYASCNDSVEKAVSSDVVVRGTDTVTIEDLHLTATGSVTGHVILGNTQTGNSGFLVFLAGTSFMAVTNDSGYFCVSGIPAGNDYQLMVSKGNFFSDEILSCEVRAKSSTDAGTININSNDIQADNGTVVWKGSHSSAEEMGSPVAFWAYFNTTDGCSYIYDGTQWVSLSQSDASDYSTIIIPEGTTNIGALSNYIHNVETVIIPSGAERILDEAFMGCTTLKSVVIPDTVTYIGEKAFYGCTNLESIIIPDSVTAIGFNAFGRCDNLKSITLPFIGGDRRFTSSTIENKFLGFIFGAEKNSSQRASIPETLKEVVLTSSPMILSSAFSGCSGISRIVIPASVRAIQTNAFMNCSGLVDIVVDPNNQNYSSIDGMLFNSEKTELLSYTGATGDVSDIPSTVEKIGMDAFYNCKNMTSVVIPDSVTTIYASFTRCIGLTSITLPNSVTSISGAFSGCTGLTSITLPDSITDITDAFSGCTGLTSITIPNSVTSIGSSAFSGCTGLTSITIPDSVTSIGGSAFYGCTGLTSITIPDSVTSIGSSAFSGCTGMTSITLPDSVTSIGDYAFSGCTGMTSITIPNSVTSIGNYAFSDCDELASITFNGTITQWKSIEKGYAMMYGNPSPSIIHCTDGDLELY